MKTLATKTGIMPLASNEFGHFGKLLWNINFICSNSAESHTESTKKYELLQNRNGKERNHTLYPIL